MVRRLDWPDQLAALLSAIEVRPTEAGAGTVSAPFWPRSKLYEVPPSLTPLSLFDPEVLRTVPEERKLIAEWMERVLAAHPAWPWPLIEEEARRRAEEALAAPRR